MDDGYNATLAHPPTDASRTMTATARRLPGSSARDTRPSQEDVVAISRAAGDARRALLLRLLRHDSFSVTELVQLLDTAQPALSHHLKILREAGLVTARKEATSTFYRRAEVTGHPLKTAIFQALDANPLCNSLKARIDELHAERERHVERFFATNADALRSQRLLICQADVYAPSLRDLWQQQEPRRHALEVGPGDVAILESLATDFETVTAIDQAEAMLAPVRDAVTAQRNITFQRQEFTRLRTRLRFDAIVAAMVLHHMPSPRALFTQASRLLSSGGRLFIAELERHEHHWVRDACGDIWLGFTTDELDQWAGSAGLRPGPRQFLAQKNGFSIQILTYEKEQT